MSEEVYDSTLDTLRHSRRVDELLLQLITDLQARLTKHDQSKMEPPEKEMYDRVTPRLKASTYGSEEYKGFLADMGEGLAHHYAKNRHHPECHEDGVNGMTLVDVAEMVCDWKAATERHDDGSLEKSFPIQAKRFDLAPQLVDIMRNTAIELGWIPKSRPLVQCKFTASVVNYPCGDECDPRCAPDAPDGP